MKKTILAVIMLLMATPVLANDATAVEQNDTATLEQNMSTDETGDIDAMSTEDRQWGRSWTCRASDRRGRTFIGRDWNRGRAYSEAMRNCRRFAFWGGCYFRGCYRSGWGGGHNGGHHGGNHGGHDGGHHGRH